MKIYLKNFFCLFTLFLCVHGVSFGADFSLVAGINYPYFISYSNYGVRGIAIEIITEALKAEKLSYSLDKANWPWKRALDTFNDKKNTIGFATKTPGREKLYKWINRIVDDDLFVFTAVKNKKIKNIGELRKLTKIGVLAGSGSDDTIITKGLKNQRFPCKDDKQCLELLVKGRIDAWVASKYKSSYWIKEFKLSKSDGIEKGMRLLDSDIWVIASLPTQELEITKLTNVFRKFKKTKEYSGILKKYE